MTDDETPAGMDLDEQALLRFWRGLTHTQRHGLTRLLAKGPAIIEPYLNEPNDEVDPDDPLLGQLEAAIDGAYDAAPQGEGVMGALIYAARAALLVTRGFTASEAVAKCIGNSGHYGVRRTHALIPGPNMPSWRVKRR